uniref:PUM-HD domain-containing protein n=1 Tax=Parascaris univalens TaxID=6257 RepID=A0A915A4F7_PARUN
DDWTDFPTFILLRYLDSSQKGIGNTRANQAVNSMLVSPSSCITPRMPCFSIPPPSLLGRSPKMGQSLRHFGNTINGTPLVVKSDNQLFSLRRLIESGEIVDLVKSKRGYAVVENNFPVHGDPSRTKLYDTFLLQNVFYSICADPIGNFFMQMLVEQSSRAERARITSLVQGHLTILSCNRYSTRVVQKLWRILDENTRLFFLGELDGHEIDIAIDENGTHFIQMIISSSPISTLTPMVRAFISTNVRLVTLAEDRNGCRVLQIVIEKFEREIVPTTSQETKIFAEKLLIAVVANLERFVNHQFANYVIQCIFSLSVLSGYANMAIYKLFGRLLVLSQEKYASHVVEKALECGSTTALCSIMDEIFDGYQCDSDGADALEILMFDEYGNYVVQKMFEVAIDVRNGKRSGKVEWFGRMAQRIDERHDQLCRYSSGKKLIDRLSKALKHTEVNDMNQNLVMP